MKEHPEYVKAYRKANVQACRDAVNKSAAKTTSKTKRTAKRIWDWYRLTPEEQQQIRQFQAAHPEYKLVLGKNEGTDHDHKTGLIRGLMDWRVNMAYGLLEAAAKSNIVELPKLMRSLALYAEQPPAELALGQKRYGLIGLAKYKKKMVYGPPL